MYKGGVNMADIKFSVIVLSHNNNHIKLVIQSILPQLAAGDEIIIVDDHSEEKYLNELKNYALPNNISVLNAYKYGNRSHSRNLGARNSVNQILLFIDGDIVLTDTALNVLRHAHTYRLEGAFIGPKHNIHYDELHFKLFSGMDNYIELLQTPGGCKLLAESYLSPDERESFFCDPNNRKFFWMHYYTGASSIRKDIFDRCGGFDESFTTWGSEDIDLGYRMSRYCEIGFIKDFHSFHIPHNRDVFDIETTNMQNTLKMLEKYKTWEFEVLYSFNGNPDILKSFYNIVNQMRTIALSPIEEIENSDGLIINTVSQKYPYGNIIIKASSKYEHNHLLGLAMPYPSHYFEEVCISDQIFIYPPLVTSRILQEALRVGKNTYIQKTTDVIRIDWNQKLFFPATTSNYRIAYRSDDIMDFHFEEEADKIKVLSALPENVMRSPKFLESRYDGACDTMD